MAYAAFRSIGAYVPQKILDNVELSKMVDTSDEWIMKRTGIQERHIAAEDEKTSDMGVKAAELAIQRSGIAKEDIDLVICGTISPDYFCMPSTATVISGKIWLYPEFIQMMISKLATEARAPHVQKNSIIDKMSKRESQIAYLVKDGLNNKDIALRTGITERTVKAHLSSIFEKTVSGVGTKAINSNNNKLTAISLLRY